MHALLALAAEVGLYVPGEQRNWRLLCVPAGHHAPGLQGNAV
jgi:hypothetical protein